jgi:hypothetical protein
MDLLRIVFAIILPPLGVFLQVGIGKHFLDQHLADDPRLHPRHNPCGLGNREILSPTLVYPRSKAIQISKVNQRYPWPVGIEKPNEGSGFLPFGNYTEAASLFGQGTK